MKLKIFKGETGELKG